MTEVEKLTDLRQELVGRRRMLIENYQEAVYGEGSANSIEPIRTAIDAVDMAISAVTQTESVIRRAGVF